MSEMDKLEQYLLAHDYDFVRKLNTELKEAMRMNAEKKDFSKKPVKVPEQQAQDVIGRLEGKS